MDLLQYLKSNKKCYIIHYDYIIEMSKYIIISLSNLCV